MAVLTDKTYFNRESAEISSTPFGIYVNQAGYGTENTKVAAIPFECSEFEITDGENIVYSGKTESRGYDKDSGDNLWTADFSDFKKQGRYRVKAGGKSSAEFEISDKVYEPVLRDVMRAFYFLRCGCGLDEKYAGVYNHAPCHNGQAVFWEDESVRADVSGGWHDAGDYGRYVTPGAAALAHLLYAYRMFPQAFAGIRTNIPDSCGIPDLLTECKVELAWIMKMQDSEGGVYHKATTKGHAPFVMPEDDTAQMYVLPVSSMAAADTAAVCALAAGIYKAFDENFSAELRECAERAYGWLKNNPDYYFSPPKECTTGGYGERNDRDNRFWAAAEMYSLTGEKKYHDDMLEYLQCDLNLTALGYGDTAGFGTLSYLLTEQEQDTVLAEKFRQAYIGKAEFFKENSEKCGYGTALLPKDYYWGSNMNVLKAGMTFIIAAELCGRKDFIPYAVKQADYICGANPMGISYISGTGEYCINNPHYRPAAADGIEKCHEGMISGGPNSHPGDADAARLIPQGTPPMKCFADVTECYSLNEITIYWNSPGVFLFGYLSLQ